MGAAAKSFDLYPSGPLSRRDFLKISGMGLVGLFTPSIPFKPDTPIEEQGRIVENDVILYDTASFQGKAHKKLWKDSVITISDVTVGDGEPSFNRVWYTVNGSEGFVHSGSVQPVKTQLNPAIPDIPDSGVLAEVTVPFTDAHWRADKKFAVAYRLYYETTHWVTGLVYDKAGQPWYRIAEDKWKLRYFAPATHFRLIPSEELAPLSPDLPPFAKRIEVRTPEQIVIAFEWDQPIFVAKAATGAIFSNGNFSTPPGRHVTAQKRPSRHMAAGNLAYNGYDLPGVPWISYITESGISFHGTYWHNNFGRPRSHGCINLAPKAAKWVYLWSLPAVPADEEFVHEDTGTIVDVI